MNKVYMRMYEGFQNGFITETEWKEYVNEVFLTILNDNREVFVRLKYR